MELRLPEELQAFQDALRERDPDFLVVAENPTHQPYVAFQRPNLLWVVCHFHWESAVHQPFLHAKYIASKIAMCCQQLEGTSCQTIESPSR